MFERRSIKERDRGELFRVGRFVFVIKYAAEMTAE